MTAVAGFVDKDNTVWIGADSCGSSDWNQVIRRDPKVFHRGPFLFGFTTSFRMGQIIRYRLPIIENTSNKPAFEFLVTEFIDALRDCFKAAGFAKKTEEVESAGTFLVGYRQKLYRIGSDYQVGENHHGYDAVGCGEAYCLGSLATTAEMDLDPRSRMDLALSAAARHSTSVAAPFVVEKQEAV